MSVICILSGTFLCYMNNDLCFSCKKSQMQDLLFLRSFLKNFWSLCSKVKKKEFKLIELCEISCLSIDTLYIYQTIYLYKAWKLSAFTKFIMKVNRIYSSWCQTLLHRQSTSSCPFWGQLCWPNQLYGIYIRGKGRSRHGMPLSTTLLYVINGMSGFYNSHVWEQIRTTGTVYEVNLKL